MSKTKINLLKKTLLATSFGCAIMFIIPCATQVNSQSKTAINNTSNNGDSKIDVNDLFASYVAPIVEQSSPTPSEIIDAIINANPDLAKLVWSDLDVKYNNDGTITISAIQTSQIYFGSTNKCLATQIVATPSDATLRNVGDTILVTARLSGLWKSAYKWNYQISQNLLNCLNIVEDYNSQTIAFTLKQLYFGESVNFDISCTILGIAKSNTLNINVNSRGVSIIGNDVLINAGDIVVINYPIDNIDGSCWKYSCENSKLEDFVKITRQSENFIFSMKQKYWTYHDTVINAWYEKNGVKTNVVSFHIIPDVNYNRAQNLLCNLEGAGHGHCNADHTGGIDSNGITTYINDFYFNMNIPSSDMTLFRKPISLSQLLHSNFINNLSFSIPDNNCHIHHWWTYAGSGYPSEDIYHSFGLSYIDGNQILLPEWVVNISGTAQMAGTTVYVQPKLNLSEIFVQWDEKTDCFTYGFTQKSFECTNIMWDQNQGWTEQPTLLK